MTNMRLPHKYGSERLSSDAGCCRSKVQGNAITCSCLSIAAAAVLRSHVTP